MASWQARSVARSRSRLAAALAVLPTVALAGTPCVPELELCPPTTGCIDVGQRYECRPYCENVPRMPKTRLDAAVDAAFEEDRIDRERAWGDAEAWLRLWQAVERHLGCSIGWPGPPRALP